MLTFALFPIALFFLGAAMVTGLPIVQALQSYYANRGRQAAVCPGSGEAVNVEVDNAYAFRTALDGLEHSRLKSCSHWPEQGDCGQECLAQVDASPENVERLLSMWYEGKSCAICTRSLQPSDWQRSRVGLLNEHYRRVEMRQIYPDNLQAALRQMRPLCWSCHLEERARQAVPDRLFRAVAAN